MFQIQVQSSQLDGFLFQVVDRDVNKIHSVFQRSSRRNKTFNPDFGINSTMKNPNSSHVDFPAGVSSKFKIISLTQQQLQYNRRYLIVSLWDQEILIT